MKFIKKSSFSLEVCSFFIENQRFTPFFHTFRPKINDLHYFFIKKTIFTIKPTSQDYKKTIFYTQGLFSIISDYFL